MQKLAVTEIAFAQVALARLREAEVNATTTNAIDPADIEFGGTTVVIWVADDADLDRARRIVADQLRTAG